MELTEPASGGTARAARRWARLLLSRRPDAGLRVFYGHDVVPDPGARAAGGTAKSQRLATRFPNSPTDFTLLYLGSTWLPSDLRPLLALARRRSAPVVLNQDGIAYPGVGGSGDRELEPDQPTRASGCRPRPLPEPVQQGLR